MKNETTITRGRIIRKGCCASSSLALPYLAAKSLFGKGGTPPSQRITIGAIGIGSQGTNDLRGFLQLSDAQVVAACGIYIF